MNRYIVRCGMLLMALTTLTMWACLGEPPQTIQPTGQSSAAIIGGTPDTRHPAVGSLQANRSSFCTGTLVASRLVLTAAHCITSALSSQSRGIKIEFRVDTPSGGTFTSKYYEVGAMQNHPQYTARPIAKDLGYAVLKLDATGVTPMPIHTVAMTNTWVNRKILFLGYGLINTNPRQSPGKKYAGEITLRQMQSDRFMTQDSGKSICSGDSGGPALYLVNGTMTLVGVNSYVTGTSTSAGPLCNGSGWSFRIDPFLTWIQPLINQHGGKCKADKDCGACYICDTTAGKCKLKGSAKTASYCKPCADPSTCGGSKDMCVRQSVGNRCLQACDNNGCCPLGTSCQDTGGGLRQCVPDSKVCADVACTADTECGPGEGCSNGTCKPKPVPPDAKLCKKCAADTDCVTGAKCETFPDGKYCTMPCVADNFCPGGYACQLVGNTRQCMPTGGNCKCAATADCHTGFACQQSICQRQGGGKFGDKCDAQRKCAAGHTCISGSCYQDCKGELPPSTPGSACQNGRCASGTQCLGVNGVPICLHRCTSDANCTRGGTCSTVGNVKLCLCSGDSDCKSPNICNKSLFSQFATCAPKNTALVKCSNGFECVYAGGTSERCLPPASQESGQNCDGNLRCKDGMVCANVGNGSICLRRCTSTASCVEGGVCSRTRTGNFCFCNGSSACNSGFICKTFSGATGACTPGKCTKDADCGNNNTCENGTCKSGSSGCRNDVDCQLGERCQDSKCVPGPTPEPPTPEPTADAATPEPPQPDAAPVADTPAPVADTPAPVADTTTAAPDTITKEGATTDIPGTDKVTAQPPPKGCGGCHANTSAPAPSGLWWLLVLLLPMWRRQRK